MWPTSPGLGGLFRKQDTLKLEPTLVVYYTQCGGSDYINKVQPQHLSKIYGDSFSLPL